MNEFDKVLKKISRDYYAEKISDEEMQKQLRAAIDSDIVHPREERLNSLLARKEKGETGLGKLIKDASQRLVVAQMKADMRMAQGITSLRNWKAQLRGK